MVQAAEIENVGTIEDGNGNLDDSVVATIEKVETTDAEDSTGKLTEVEDSKPVDNVDNDDDGDGDDDLIVTIGDESQEVEPAPEWVKELRKSHRETQRENRNLKAQMEEMTKTETKPVGAKPKLEDFDYDSDLYEAAYDKWLGQKREAETEIEAEKAKTKAAADEWQKTLDAHGEKKASLKVKDFDEAEAAVLEAFTNTQQAIIVQGAENSALVMYALGKTPAKIKELAAITDPIKFAFAVARLEVKDMKVTTRKAPPPESKVITDAPASGVTDSTLARLRTEAAKTGDFSKVSDYKRKHKKT